MGLFSAQQDSDAGQFLTLEVSARESVVKGYGLSLTTTVFAPPRLAARTLTETYRHAV